ncbi:hypothetical protein [uncultured Rikenella sp.]|uniref:hypothetical protein n=1 Tax=uncultured Rikenella sp. TaxID=368003 RepID=UPI002630D6E5|nr:hypothetical protein [uncultured Rikenella sp.]
MVALHRFDTAFISFGILLEIHIFSNWVVSLAISFVGFYMPSVFHRTPFLPGKADPETAAGIQYFASGVVQGSLF